MTGERKLYPLKFVTESTEGGKYHLADLGYIDSISSNGWLGGNSLSDIMQTYLERVVGDISFEFNGTQFPVMVKTLDVHGELPLCVNPDDKVAEQRYDAFGKTALWYVAEASDDALLYLGFEKAVSADLFYGSCLGGTVKGLLHKISPSKGDFFLIRPGTVYAASGKMTIIEVSEASELVFRLEGGSPDEGTMLEEAFDIIDFAPYDPSLRLHVGEKESPETIVSLPQFTLSRIALSDPVKVSSENSDSYLLYVCISGAAAVQVTTPGSGGNEIFRLERGEVILIPAEVTDFHLVPTVSNTILFEVRQDPREEKDSYLG